MERITKENYKEIVDNLKEKGFLNESNIVKSKIENYCDNIGEMFLNKTIRKSSLKNYKNTFSLDILEMGEDIKCWDFFVNYDDKNIKLKKPTVLINNSNKIEKLIIYDDLILINQSKKLKINEILAKNGKNNINLINIDGKIKNNFLYSGDLFCVDNYGSPLRIKKVVCKNVPTHIFTDGIDNLNIKKYEIKSLNDSECNKIIFSSTKKECKINIGDIVVPKNIIKSMKFNGFVEIFGKIKKF